MEKASKIEKDLKINFVESKRIEFYWKEYRIFGHIHREDKRILVHFEYGQRNGDDKIMLVSNCDPYNVKFDYFELIFNESEIHVFYSGKSDNDKFFDGIKKGERICKIPLDTIQFGTTILLKNAIL